jgi:hypothetical protein
MGDMLHTFSWTVGYGAENGWLALVAFDHRNFNMVNGNEIADKSVRFCSTLVSVQYDNTTHKVFPTVIHPPTLAG